MRIQIKNNQYKKLIKEIFGVNPVNEQGETSGDSSPKSGTSSDGEKKTNASKWESGVTRGPANQIGITKWSDIVGASLKRGKANPLTEQSTPTPKPVSNSSLQLDLSKNLPDPSKLPLLQGAFGTGTFDLKKIQNRIESEEANLSKENKKFAPAPVYTKNENLFDFIDQPIDENPNEVAIKNFKDGKQSGVQNFVTFWGQNVKIDTNVYDVVLYLPNQNRTENFNIIKAGTVVKDDALRKFEGKYQEYILTQDAVAVKKIGENGNIEKFYYFGVPSETTLKRYFPDYTIRSITEKSTKKRYRTIIAYDTVHTLKKENITRGGISVYLKSWRPNLGYFYPDSGEKPVLSGNLTPFPLFDKKIVIDPKYENSILKLDKNGAPKLWTREDEAQAFKDRISFNNTKTPKGFNPRNYDKYIDEIKPYQWSIIQILRRLETLSGTNIISNFKSKSYEEKEKYLVSIYTSPESLNILNSNFGPIEERLNEYRNLVSDLLVNFENIDKIYKNYRSPVGKGGVFEFSYGISEDQREQYYKALKQENYFNNEMIREINNVLNIIELREDTPYDQYLKIKEHENEYRIWSMYLRSELNRLYKQKENIPKTLKGVYGYDYTKPSFMGKEFDEFWDEYGFFVQLLGNVAFILAGGWVAAGVGAIFRVGAGSFLRYIAPYVADATFNALVAAYQVDRGQNKEALLSLVCVLVPFGKFGLNIGKVSQQAAESLSVKISKLEPGFLSTPGAFEKLMVELTDEEIEILQNIYSLPRQSYSRLAKELETEAGQFMKTSSKLLGQKSGLGWKMFLDEFIFEAGIPLVAGMTNSFLGLVENEINFELKPEQWLKMKETFESWIEDAERKNKEQAEFATLATISDPSVKGKLKNAKNAKEVEIIIISKLNEKYNTSAEENAEELTNLMNQMGGIEELKKLKSSGDNVIKQIN